MQRTDTLLRHIATSHRESRLTNKEWLIRCPATTNISPTFEWCTLPRFTADRRTASYTHSIVETVLRNAEASLESLRLEDGKKLSLAETSKNHENVKNKKKMGTRSATNRCAMLTNVTDYATVCQRYRREWQSAAVRTLRIKASAQNCEQPHQVLLSYRYWSSELFYENKFEPVIALLLNTLGSGVA